MRKIERQVGDYLVYCKKVRGMSSTTLGAKRSILERFVRVTGVRDLGGVTNGVFDQWVGYLVEKGVAGRSVNTYNGVVIAMVRYYQGMGVEVPLKVSLVRKLKEGPVRRRFYTAREIAKVLVRADFETGLMIRIMFETGMRIAELTNLRLADFSGRQIRFTGKGRKLREVYVREETLRGVQELITRRGLMEGYLFGTLNGEPPTTATIRKKLKKPFLEVGLEGFYPHAIRHSFATDLQLKGASVAEIKEMMGHESVATTERYLHGFEGRLEELFDKYR